MRLARRLAAGFLLFGLAATASADDLPCPSAKAAPLALPRLREALASNHEAVVVAFGSSSTQGWHASDLGHSYPAILQASLSAALPAAHVAVLNRGVGGQDVSDELPRLARDAMDLYPALVVWQVGANWAMRRMEPRLFKSLVATGVAYLQAANADVVLMDNQRAPAILASPDHARIDQALAEVAATSGAGLFRRGDLMEQWQAAGHPYEQFMSGDGVHHNDRGYRCVAKALAQAILDGLGAPASPHAVADKR